MDITLGQIAYSKAGRDEGKKFVIVKIIDDTFALVADGDLRRIEKPKKKRLKHLKLSDRLLDVVRNKLESDEKLTNSEIRKALATDEEKK